MSGLSSVEVTFLGHSTVLLEFEPEPGAPRTRLLTDPVLRGRVGPLAWHGERDGVRHVPVDAVLVSHAHRDHLDLPSLDEIRAAGEQPRLIVPAGIGPLLRGRGFLRVQEVVPGDRLAVGGATIRVVRAEHDGMRRPFGPRADAVGYLVEEGPSVYFAGDTGLFDEMGRLGRAVDLALLPVAGWSGGRDSGRLDPVAAAQAVQRLDPRVVIPIHWGALFPIGLRRIWPKRLRNPGRELAAEVIRRGIDAEVRILQPGESTRLSCVDAELLEAAL